jgi:peptide/nickel transport system permease protein
MSSATEELALDVLVRAPAAPRRGGVFWRRFRRSPAAVGGALIVLAVLLAALFAPELSPYPQAAGAYVDFRARHLPPGALHWLGTDEVGRDLLTRVLFGYRTSLLLAFGVLVTAVPVGVLLGLLAGYYRGAVETVIMGATDIALAIPPLLLALAVTSILSPNLVNMMIALAVLWWTWHTRLIYNLVRSLTGEDYIDACRVIGAGAPHIMFRELLPNCLSAIFVKVSLDAGFVILIGASLSYLGLGVRPPTPDLGSMIQSGTAYLPMRWWEAVMPCGALFIIILGFNLLGDGLRDVLDAEAH